MPPEAVALGGVLFWVWGSANAVSNCKALAVPAAQQWEAFKGVLEWPYTVGGAGGGATIVGKNAIYHWESLVGPFLVHKLLCPRPPLTLPPSNPNPPPPPGEGGLAPVSPLCNLLDLCQTLLISQLFLRQCCPSTGGCRYTQLSPLRTMSAPGDNMASTPRLGGGGGGLGSVYHHQPIATLDENLVLKTTGIFFKLVCIFACSPRTDQQHQTFCF